MKKGILTTIVYYLVGVLVTVISYYAFDHSYAHGPSFYHLTALLTFFVGIFWTVVVATQFLFIERNEKRKGIILTNIVILLCAYLTFYMAVLRPYGRDSAKERSEDRLTTEINGDTTIISHGGRIIYMKVQDSTYLDLRDMSR